MIQYPSQGRIVIYRHPGTADGTSLGPVQTSPAIVQDLNEDGTVSLWVFGPTGLFMNDRTHYGDGPCQWSWPKREG